MIDSIKAVNPAAKIVLAASIAPYCPTYTDGSANLPQPRKQVECETVKVYLQNLVNFAASQHFLLADAYHASLNGTEGNPKYINQGDHIHASDSGKKLMAEKIALALGSVINWFTLTGSKCGLTMRSAPTPDTASVLYVSRLSYENFKQTT